MRDAMRRMDLRKSGEAYDLELEFDGQEMYATRNGVRIAKRHKRKWVSLLADLTVVDVFQNGRPMLELRTTRR